MTGKGKRKSAKTKESTISHAGAIGNEKQQPSKVQKTKQAGKVTVVGSSNHIDSRNRPVSDTVMAPHVMQFATNGGRRPSHPVASVVSSTNRVDATVAVPGGNTMNVPDEAWFFSKKANEARLSQVHELRKFVKDKLFPRWKFFTHRSQLMWTSTPNSICHYVCEHMHLRPEYKERWWHHHQEDVMKELNRKRSDVCSAMKKVFLGKFHF